MVMPVPCFQNSERGDRVSSAIVSSPDRKPVRSDALLGTPCHFRPKDSAESDLAERAFRSTEANNREIVPNHQCRTGTRLLPA